MVATKKFKQTIGSKRLVWAGTAEKTSYGKNGLKKKDLMRVKKRGEYRIVSRKQHEMAKKPNSKSQVARKKWTDAVKKARKELIAKKVIEKGVFVPILKRVSSKYNKSVNSKGRALYRRAKEIYESTKTKKSPKAKKSPKKN